MNIVSRSDNIQISYPCREVYNIIMPPKRRKCYVCGEFSTINFSFPVDENKRKLWLDYLGKDDVVW